MATEPPEHPVLRRKRQLDALRADLVRVEASLRRVAKPQPGRRSTQISLGPLAADPDALVTIGADAKVRVTHQGREIDTSAREAADLARKRIGEVDAALEQFGTALNQLGGDLSLLDGHVRQDFDDELRAVNEDGDPIVDLGHFESGATSSDPVAPRTGHYLQPLPPSHAPTRLKSNIEALYESLIEEEDREVEADKRRFETTDEADTPPWTDLEHAHRVPVRSSSAHPAPPVAPPDPSPPIAGPSRPSKRVSFDVPPGEPQPERESKPSRQPSSPARPVIRDTIVERNVPHPLIRVVERDFREDEDFETNDSDDSDDDDEEDDDDDEEGDPMVHFDDLLHNRQIALEYHRRRHGVLTTGEYPPAEPDDDLLIDDDGTVVPRVSQSRFRAGPASTLQTATMVLPSAVLPEQPTDAAVETELDPARLEALMLGRDAPPEAPRAKTEVDKPEPTPAVPAPSAPGKPVTIAVGEVHEREVDSSAEPPAAPAPRPAGRISKFRAARS